MIGKNKQLNLLQILRGLATLIVVIRHVTGNSVEILKQDFLGNIFSFGSLAVDIFFVLSGFIITYTSLNKASDKNALISFLRRRLIRVFPVYWIIISLFFLLQLLLPAFYNNPYPASAGHLIPTYLLFPGHIMLNGVSWTLSYELFFYFIFILFFLIPNRTLVLVLLGAFAGTVILFAVLDYPASLNPWVGLILFPMNVEFIFGVFAAVLIPKINPRLSLPLIFIAVIYFILSVLISDNEFLMEPSLLKRVLLFGVPAVLLIVGLAKYELNKNIKVPAFLVVLGEASYSLYLLHLPIIAACCKLVAKLNLHSGMLIQALLIFAIILICIGSIVFYRIVESPIITKLNAVFQKRRSISLSPSLK